MTQTITPPQLTFLSLALGSLCLVGAKPIFDPPPRKPMARVTPARSPNRTLSASVPTPASCREAACLWSPRETTAFPHEVGHFVGLDHSNLHPGRIAIVTNQNNSFPSAGGFPASITPILLQTAVLSDVGGFGHGSLDVAPGTVIEIPIAHTGLQALENVSRPLVEIVPRTFRPAPTGFVTINVTSNLAIQSGTESLTINGVVVPNLSLYKSASGPNQSQWMIPGSLLPPGPARLRFKIKEQSTPGSPSPVFGINEVQY